MLHSLLHCLGAGWEEVGWGGLRFQMGGSTLSATLLPFLTLASGMHLMGKPEGTEADMVDTAHNLFFLNADGIKFPLPNKSKCHPSTMQDKTCVHCNKIIYVG